MPELPEVETTVRALVPCLQGRRIARVHVNRPDLRHPFPADLARVLANATVTGLGRRAKYGLIHTDRARTMVFHLGMSGRWRIAPATLGRHDHLVLDIAATHQAPAHRLALHDARRFGTVDLIETSALATWPPFAALGPEPLRLPLTDGDPAILSAAYLATAFAGRAASVKTLLLDQHVVAGLGNIYVCEALHRAHIHPETAGGDLPRRILSRLVRDICAVLTEAVATGGSTIRDYAQPGGEPGYFAAQWRVYGREGETCGARSGHRGQGGRGKRCDGVIRRTVQAGRSSFWCPACQNLAGNNLDAP